jgi:hypothetical protein
MIHEIKVYRSLPNTACEGYCSSIRLESRAAADHFINMHTQSGKYCRVSTPSGEWIQTPSGRRFAMDKGSVVIP